MYIQKADFLQGSLYVDQVQTGMAVRRFQSDERFIAPRMIPRVIVKKPSGLYTVVNMADMNRDEMEARANHAPAKRAAWGYSNAIFSTDARSLEYDLNDAAQAASDVERDPEVVIPRALAYKANLHAERRMAAKFFVAANWHRVVTGAAADNAGTAVAKNRMYWSDAAADPILAIQDEIRIQSMLTGQKPTGMAFGNRLWHIVRNHAKVRAQVMTVFGASQNLQGMSRAAEAPEFAALCGLKWVGVSEAIFNLALENEAANNQPIVPENDALLFFDAAAGVENHDGMLTLESDEPSAFGRFVWNGVASEEGIQIRKFRKEDIGPGGSWAHVIDVYNGFEIITKECGTYFVVMAQ